MTSARIAPSEKTHRIFSLLLSFLALSSAPLSAKASSDWSFEKTAGTSLVLKNAKTQKTETLKTSVPSPKFVAVLSDPDSGAPYVFYEGKTCPKCDSGNTSFFLQRLDGRGLTASFIHPGKIIEVKKNRNVYTSRLFYGHCLPSVKQGVVVHQTELVDRRGYQKSVSIAEPGPQYIYEVLLERRLPALKTTLDLVKRGVCTEISGKTRNVLKRPLDLTPKKGLDDEEEEEDSEKKSETSENSDEGDSTISD
jgi:hypothetical protein